MRRVKIDHGSDLHKKGWRNAIEIDRWEDMLTINKLYTYWLYHSREPNGFNMHFTISKDNRWLVCFADLEEMFLAAIYFGIVIES